MSQQKIVHVFENEMKDNIDIGKFFIIKQCFCQKKKKTKKGTMTLFCFVNN